MTEINRDLINEARLEAFTSLNIDADKTEDDMIETSTPPSPIVKTIKKIRVKKSPRMETKLIIEETELIIEAPNAEIEETELIIEAPNAEIEETKLIIEAPNAEIEETDDLAITSTHYFDPNDEETYAPYYAEQLGGGIWYTMGIDKLRACMKVFGVGLSRMKICSISLQIRRGRCLQVIDKYLNADDCDSLKCMEINEILKPIKDKKKKTKEEVLGSGIVEYKLKL